MPSSKAIEIKIISKKIVSIIVPHFFGFIILKVRVGTRVKKYLWAFGLFSKVWGGWL